LRQRIREERFERVLAPVDRDGVDDLIDVKILEERGFGRALGGDLVFLSYEEHADEGHRMEPSLASAPPSRGNTGIVCMASRPIVNRRQRDAASRRVDSLFGRASAEERAGGAAMGAPSRKDADEDTGRRPAKPAAPGMARCKGLVADTRRLPPKQRFDRGHQPSGRFRRTPSPSTGTILGAESFWSIGQRAVSGVRCLAHSGCWAYNALDRVRGWGPPQAPQRLMAPTA